MIPVKDNIPSERVAVMTLALIAAQIAVYIWGGDDALLVLATNVLFLWIFGNSLEEAVGRARFLAFYVLGGLVTVGAARVLGAEALALVGATGAAAAMLGGYLVIYPRGRVLTVFPIPLLVTVVAIPAIAFLGVWAAIQVAVAVLDLNGAVGSDELTEYLAPVAGLLFGAAAVKVFATHRSAAYTADSPLRDGT